MVHLNTLKPVVFLYKLSFPSLANVIANQTTFNLYNVEGTMAGYRFLRHLNGVNVDGYHCHFITDDLTAGGHMLTLLQKMC